MPVDPDEVYEEQQSAKTAPEVDDGDRGDNFDTDDSDGRVKTADPKSKDVRSEDEGEPAGDEDTPDDGADEKRQTLTIPKYRYDSQAAKTRAAEAEVQRLKKQLEATAESGAPAAAESKVTQTELDAKLAELDDAIEAAVLDNDVKKVRELRLESRKLERDFFQDVSTRTATQMSSQAVEKIKFDQTVEMLENEFEQLDPDSDKYDDTTVNEVLDMQEAFVATGKYSPSDAMLRAVGYVLKGADPAQKSEGRRTPIKKNAEDSNRQPPDLDGVGTDSDKSGKRSEIPDIRKLTTEEFDALPEVTKRRMRGDLV